MHVFLVYYLVVLSPNRSLIKSSIQMKVSPSQWSTSIRKRSTSTTDWSHVIMSPTWRSSFDEQLSPSTESRIRASPTNVRYSSDEMRHLIIRSIGTNSLPNQTFTSFNSFLNRQRHGHSMIELNQESNRTRLSARSISYGFGLATGTRPTSVEQQKILFDSNNISPNYRLPANKIDLNLHQHNIDLSRRAFKR
jgi:hypothetical protein